MDERGQAAVEWVGLVALVGALLVGALLVLGPADSVGHAFVRQFQRALCIVGGGVCDLDRRPCPVASSSTIDDAQVSLSVLRLGHQELILYERRSDGSVLVTYLGDTGGGLELALAGQSASARIALIASVGGGETWRFADAYAADQGMAALSEDQRPARGELVEDISRNSLEAEADASVEGSPLSGSLALRAGVVEATSRDPRDGSSTHILTRRASAGLALAVGEHGAEGAAAGEDRIAVRVAADGRPLELTITRSGSLEGSFDLPDGAQGIAQELAGGAEGGQRWVVEKRLDLTSGESLRLARDYLARADRGSVGMIGRETDALRERIDQVGVTELRTYRLAGEDRGRLGLAGHTPYGRVGFSVGDRVEEIELIGARVRGPDGEWRERTDCLGWT